MSGPGPGDAQTGARLGGPSFGETRDPMLAAMLRLWVAQGGQKDFPVTGESMAPVLTGIEGIRARLGPTEVRFGDVLLFYRNDKLVAHRMVGRRPGGYRTRGDASKGFDKLPVSHEELLGVVTHVLWKDHTLSLDGAGASLARLLLGTLGVIAGRLRIAPAVDPQSGLPGRLRDRLLGPLYRFGMQAIFRAYSFGSRNVARIVNTAHAYRSEGLFAELRGDVDGEPADRAEERDGASWQRIVRSSIQTGLGPVLLGRLRQSGRLARLPSHLQHELETTYYLMALYNTRSLADLASLVEAMVKAGLRPIVLKGGALAGRLYDNIAVRAVRDLDLLLLPEEIEIADVIMRAHGYTQPFPKARYETHFHLPPYVPPRGHPRVEIHTGLIRPTFRAQPDLDAMRERAVPIAVGSVEARAFCPEDQALHCCLHLGLADQFVRGVKDLSDIDALVRRPGFDCAAFVEEAERRGLGRVAFYAIEWTRRVFATPFEERAWRALTRHRLPALEHRFVQYLIAGYLTALPDNQEFFGLARAKRVIRVALTEERRTRRMRLLAARLIWGGAD